MVSILSMIVIFCILLWIIISDSLFRKTEYYRQTQKTPFTFLSDKGSYGEYLTYKGLKSYEKSGAKFLFNCYLPTQDGKTSEIDVMMIHTSGIYVFESKNYSGYSLGSVSSSSSNSVLTPWIMAS